MKKINISKQVQLPMDAATQKFAFLGRSGSGKSYGAGKLAESFLENHIQTIILDPVGIWYGLRVAADGKSKGLSIPVFGGEHGDIDLVPGSGALIATLIVEKGISAVLDVSYMRKNERKQFITDFAETLFFLKKKNRSVLHLIIEESQVFVPQRTIKGEERMLGAMEDICKLGRNYGIGISLISQRPQSVHKDCLNQTEALFAFQINGAHERKAIADWVVEKGIEKKAQLDYISELEVGECFLWSPQWLKLLEKINILPKKTFDASKTPEVGDAVIKPRNLAPVDLENIKEQMKSVIDEKKKDDPRELHRQIAELRKELGNKKNGNEISEYDRKILRERNQFTNTYQSIEREFIVPVEESLQDIEDLIADAEKYIISAKNCHNSFTLFKHRIKKAASFSDKVVKQPELKKSETKIPKGKYQVNFFPSSNGNGNLPIGEKKILIACAQYDNGVSREQLTVLSGYKRSSRDAYIQRLSEKGFIEKSGDRILATQEGIDNLGNDFKPLPTGKELQQYWLNILPSGEKVILELLVNSYPRAMNRDEISEQTSYQRSSRDAYIQRMKSKEIIKIVSRGEVKASENLF